MAATGSPCWAPSSAGCVARRDHCCLVASPLPSWQLNWSGSFAVSAGSTWAGISTVHDVARCLNYRGARQSPVPQSPSAASPCRLLAVSGAALTSSSAPVAPSVFVPHTQHAAVALHGRRVHVGYSSPASGAPHSRCTSLHSPTPSVAPHLWSVSDRPTSHWTFRVI